MIHVPRGFPQLASLHMSATLLIGSTRVGPVAVIAGLSFQLSGLAPISIISCHRVCCLHVVPRLTNSMRFGLLKALPACCFCSRQHPSRLALPWPIVSGAFLEQEDVWFQGVCLSSPDADKEISSTGACKAAPCEPQLLCVQEALFVCVGLSTCLSTSYFSSYCVCSHASLQRSTV